MPDIAALLADLAAESAEIDGLVAGLDADGWALSTPATGWTIAHQIAHLAWTDEQARTAAREPEEFRARLSAGVDPGMVDVGAHEGALLPPAELLASWRAGRTELERALRSVDPGARIPWFGPPMRATSMATARQMETWAHGQDIADSLGVQRNPQPRLRNIAHIAVRTRDFAYLVREVPVPQAEFRVELTAPDGELWTWGPENAEQRVSGPALDFCLLATRRRHRDDTEVRAQGAEAQRWLSIAQAFAGPPGNERPALSGRSA